MINPGHSVIKEHKSTLYQSCNARSGSGLRCKGWRGSLLPVNAVCRCEDEALVDDAAATEHVQSAPSCYAHLCKTYFS